MHSGTFNVLEKESSFRRQKKALSLSSLSNDSHINFEIFSFLGIFDKSNYCTHQEIFKHPHLKNVNFLTVFSKLFHKPIRGSKT